MSTTELFWAKVDKSGDCWLWTARTDPKGYGRFSAGGKDGYAHRYALAATGVNLGGQQVDHICHNKSCVRPEHLRAVTNKQNSENLEGPYANSRSGVRGVWQDKRCGRWTGTVGHNGVQHRKRFDTLEEASEWVRVKRLELFTHNDADRAA